MQRTANIQAFAFPRGLDPNDPATAAAMDAYVSGNNLHTLAYAGTFGHDAQEAEYWRQHSGELATWGQQFSLGTPDPAHAKEQYDAWLPVASAANNRAAQQAEDQWEAAIL